jgi:biotin synthase
VCLKKYKWRKPLSTVNLPDKAVEELIIECEKLYDLPLKVLQESARSLTEEYSANKVELCSIISAKTGKCEEDCAYCSQSSHYNTVCEAHDLVNVETVIKAAKDAKERGAKRFCVVISGKGIRNTEEFNTILEMVHQVSEIDGLHSCCSLGMVTLDQARALKHAGVERFNHNLNTAKSFYNKICTTHNYEERLQTARNLKEAGIELCCGGIIGMGESRRQRIEMALEIKALNPESVPINILHPIPGTPLENLKTPLSAEEILKTIAIYRIIMPEVLIRYAGGRTHNLTKEQQLEGLKSGINALLIGNYLTTIGSTTEEDHELLSVAGLEILKD